MGGVVNGRTDHDRGLVAQVDLGEDHRLPRVGDVFNDAVDHERARQGHHLGRAVGRQLPAVVVGVAIEVGFSWQNKHRFAEVVSAR